MTDHQNIFSCPCSPNHNYASLDDFNQHFQSIHHMFHECSEKTLFKDNQMLREQLKKMTEERDQWRNKYHDATGPVREWP